ncbi:MAG: DUF4398 domain-containing protein [Polyangiaceae bacterium]|nr:DUF4398 domain-containing protein [Polyangiaceae bacterium]
MRIRLPLRRLIFLGWLGLVGCGNTLYAVQANSARDSFEEAKNLGAEQFAPYEYYGAQARIIEARSQAAHAEYGNAAALAEEADKLAKIAIEKSREARRRDREEAAR